MAVGYIITLVLLSLKYKNNDIDYNLANTKVNVKITLNDNTVYDIEFFGKIDESFNGDYTVMTAKERAIRWIDNSLNVGKLNLDDSTLFILNHNIKSIVIEDISD